MDAEIDDATIILHWTSFSGQVTCPPPQGCNKQYEIPTVEEVAKLRAGAGSEPEAAQETQPTDAGPDKGIASSKTTEDSESTDTKEPEEEDEPSTLKFTGPWRPKSQSDEDGPSSMDDEFEKASSDLLFTVNNVNDAPFVSDVGDQQTWEDHTLQITLNVADVDDDYGAIEIDANVLANDDIISIDVDGHVLTLVPEPDKTGIAAPMPYRPNPRQKIQKSLFQRLP